MKSKITGGETTKLFTAKILSKYEVCFYQCKDTGFIQTEEPFWLEESYSSAITKLDVGLVMRNQNLVDTTCPILLKFFNHNGRFLDYAGGYGLFTRLMRDKGFDFYHTDIYCQNIFAENYDLKNINGDTSFDMVTAFEVLEHLISPQENVKDILNYSDNVFFTTELLPSELKNPKEWWYFSLETGQHISFYTERALRNIATANGRNYYTDGKWLHLFTKNALKMNPFKFHDEREGYLIRKMRKYLKRFDEKSDNAFPKKVSLLDHDFKEAKMKLHDI